MPASIPALAIARPVQPLLQSPGVAGQVLAAFDRSCYVESREGRIIAVLSEPLGRGAFALTVRATPSFRHVPPGHPVEVRDEHLQVGDLRIHLTPAAVWDPALPTLAAPADRGMRAVRMFLRWAAPEEGLARVLNLEHESPLLTQARQGLGLLREALQEGDVASLTAAASRLAGLGPGLTPSGDDLLAGVLLACHLWPDRAGPLGTRAVGQIVLETARVRTGRVSQAYLEAASAGHAPDRWHDFVRRLPGDPHQAVDAAARILETGETSGADMLAGFLYAWQMGETAAPARAGV